MTTLSSTISTRTPGAVSRYNGDEGRIKQILINILNNAIKFTKEGGVKASVTGRPGGNEDEELIVFRVEDSGCGIREEDLNKIFEDFRQVDSKKNRSVEGTGLGLAIVKHLVELMGVSSHSYFMISPRLEAAMSIMPTTSPTTVLRW